MSKLHIMACHLNDVDIVSLRSMLQLAAKRLNSPWEMISKGPADLYIYSTANPESQKAWLAHTTGFSAILTTESASIEGADITLKKPLRAKNFADTLNAIEEKVNFSRQADRIAEIDQRDQAAQTDKENKQTRGKTSSLFSSLSSTIAKHFSRTKSPVFDLPSLDLTVPETTENEIDTILDPELLKKWFDELAEKDNNKIVSAILTNLVPLNRTTLPISQRLSLLDVYRKPVSSLVFERDLATIKKEINSPTEFQKDLNALNLLLEELAIGYKIVINEAYQQGERPQTNKLYLLAIIRATELISVAILNAFRYYRSTPDSSLHTLHQLYLYCEAANTLQDTVSTKTVSVDRSLFQLYGQIMLTCIADPYSLAKFDIFRLYKLMGELVDKAEIIALTDSQKNAANSFVMAGNFYLDCSKDATPKSLKNTSGEERLDARGRVLNPQNVVTEINNLIKNASAPEAQGRYDLDIQLLKKISPQFDTSYERQYQRIRSVKDRKIRLADGIKNIHEGLHDASTDQLFEWMMSNQSSGGMMASRDKTEIQPLNNGDFMGIFEDNLPVKLATIRWLHTESDGIIQIGLQVHPGHPTAVSFTVDGKTEIMLGLLLPEIDDIKQAPTLIVDKGTYSEKRIFRVKEGDQTYSVQVQDLIESTLDYEQFTFTKTAD